MSVQVLQRIAKWEVARNFTFNMFRNGYASKPGGVGGVMGGALKKKKMSKLGPVMEKKVIPVETDPERLVNYVCGSNIFKTGEDIKLKPDSEYPEWLWNLRLGPPPPVEELDPNTKEYWRRVRKMAVRQQNRLRNLKQLR